MSGVLGGRHILAASLAGLLSGLGGFASASVSRLGTSDQSALPFRLVRGNKAELLRRDRRARRARNLPHQAPFVIAIRRVAGGKRAYARCVTRDQALAHRPYIIEHINGWGQVTRRERLGRDF